MAITHDDNGYAVRLQVPLATVIPAMNTYNSSAVTSFLPAIIDRGSSTASTPGLIRLSTIPSSNYNSSAPLIFDFDLPPVPYEIGNARNNAVRGFQVTDVTLAYMLASATGASTGTNTSEGSCGMTLSAFTMSQADAASFSSAVAYGGTFTYNWGSSTALTSMANGPSSNMHVVVCVPQTGLNSVINTDNQRLAFSLNMNNGTSSNFQFSLYNVAIHGKLILGG